MATDDPTPSARLLALGQQLAKLGSWERDLASGETLWSDELFRILGVEPDDTPRTEEALLEHVHPEDRRRIGGILSLVGEAPEAVPDEGYTTELRIVRGDGEVRYVRATGRIERNVRGDAVRWVGVIQDISGQAGSRELQAHHGLSETLRDWDSFDEGVVGLLQRIGEALDYPMASLWLWDDEYRGLRCRAFWSAVDHDPGMFEYAKRRLTFRPGEGKPGAAWATQAPVVTPDTATDRVFEPRDAAMTRGVRSGIAFPAIGPEGPIAVLSFYSLEHRIPTPSLVRTLTALGHDLGRFFHRRRSQLRGSPLTPREIEILRLAAEGNSRPQIAEALGISPLTVKTHFENIFEKLGVSDRTAAVAESIRTGLIE
jgi:DNA-binding CsgD family transcriptional regulator